jgi:hypothetical protein
MTGRRSWRGRGKLILFQALASFGTTLWSHYFYCLYFILNCVIHEYLIFVIFQLKNKDVCYTQYNITFSTDTFVTAVNLRPGFLRTPLPFLPGVVGCLLPPGFPLFHSPPPPRLWPVLPRSKLETRTFAVLPFHGTHSFFGPKFWVGCDYISVLKFSLGFVLWHCVVLCSNFWGFSTSEGLFCLFGCLVRYLCRCMCIIPMVSNISELWASSIVVPVIYFF